MHPISKTIKAAYWNCPKVKPQNRQKMAVNIHNNYGSVIDNHDGGKISLYQDRSGRWHVEREVTENEVIQDAEVINDENESEQPTNKPSQPKGETFADRVKAIIRKAASRNGQTIESHAKGHPGSYTYYINADCFCQAMDTLQEEEADRLSSYLSGNLESKQASQVCMFIGHTLRMNIINSPDLQIADMVFAFKDYYPNEKTVQSRLSNRTCSNEEQLLFRKFRVILNRFNT